MSRRPALSRERILEAAVRVADRSGLAGVSMRTVGKELGVEAMSLYHHLSGKEDLLDALADRVFTEIEIPQPQDPWRSAMADRAASARLALLAHPWALHLMESRAPGPALLTHHDAVLGCLRCNGFSVALATHAFSAIDAYVYGFVLTELRLPVEATDRPQEFVADLDLPLAQYPHLAEQLAEQVMGQDYRFADEFGYGLELILDGMRDRLEAAD